MMRFTKGNRNKSGSKLVWRFSPLFCEPPRSRGRKFLAKGQSICTTPKPLIDSRSSDRTKQIPSNRSSLFGCQKCRGMNRLCWVSLFEASKVFSLCKSLAAYAEGPVLPWLYWCFYPLVKTGGSARVITCVNCNVLRGSLCVCARRVLLIMYRCLPEHFVSVGRFPKIDLVFNFLYIWVRQRERRHSWLLRERSARMHQEFLDRKRRRGNEKR